MVVVQEEESYRAVQEDGDHNGGGQEEVIKAESRRMATITVAVRSGNLGGSQEDGGHKSAVQKVAIITVVPVQEEADHNGGSQRWQS